MEVRVHPISAATGFPRKKERVARAFHKQLRRLARAVLPCLEAITVHRTDVTWWIDFGTLLGFVREGDIILDDNDVDVCLLFAHEEDGPLVMEQLAQCLGDRFCVTHPYGHIYRVVERRDVIFGFFVDLYINRLDEDAVLRGATGSNSDVPLSLILGGNGDARTARRSWPRIGLHQKVVRIPIDHEGTLVWRYGEDWRLPKPGFKGRDG